MNTRSAVFTHVNLHANPPLPGRDRWVPCLSALHERSALREPQLGVVPIRVDARAGGERPYHIRKLGIDDRVERFALRFGDVSCALEEFDAPDVLVGGSDIPVTDQCNLRRWIVA